MRLSFVKHDLLISTTFKHVLKIELFINHVYSLIHSFTFIHSFITVALNVKDEGQNYAPLCMVS